MQRPTKSIGELIESLYKKPISSNVELFNLQEITDKNANSRRLMDIIGALGFSIIEIVMKKQRTRFCYVIRNMFSDLPIGEYIIAGSQSEGLMPGLTYAGEWPDTDIIHEISVFKVFSDFDSFWKTTCDSLLSNVKLTYDSNYPVYAVAEPRFSGYFKLLVAIKTEGQSVKIEYLSNRHFQSYINKLKINDVSDEIQKVSIGDRKVHGPAVTDTLHLIDHQSYEFHKFIVDNVPCLKWNFWPPEANAWVLRRKSFGWPPQLTVNRVKQMGCYLAPVGHDDSSEKEYQWRISLSGEKLLYDELNEVQICCYVLLRIILKNVLNNLHPDLITSYCLKNLVFWCVELEHISWIPENFYSCMDICLGKLMEFILQKYIPHYIIEGRNLLKSSFLSDKLILLAKSLSTYRNNLLKVVELLPFEQVIFQTLYEPLSVKYMTEKSIITCCCQIQLNFLHSLFSRLNTFWIKYHHHNALASLNEYLHIKINKLDKSITPYKYLITEMINSILGLLSYSCYRENMKDSFVQSSLIGRYRRVADSPEAFRLSSFKKQAIKHISETFYSHMSCVQLRTANLYFMEKQFLEVIKICSEILKYPVKVISLAESESLPMINLLWTELLNMSLEDMQHIRMAFVAYSYYARSEMIKSMDTPEIVLKFTDGIQKHQHFNVTYMTAEKWAVPDVILYELLSVSPSRFTEDLTKTTKLCRRRIRGIRIHPALNASLLLFLSYNALRNERLRDYALRKIEKLETDMTSEATVLYNNVLAYCYSIIGNRRRAAHCVMTSLKALCDQTNTAFGYLKNIVSMSVEFISHFKPTEFRIS